MIPEYYNIDKFKKGLHNPSLFLNEAYRIAGVVEHKITRPIKRFKFERRYSPAVDVMEEDWDNLIILDACRYDNFLEVNNLEGELKKAISPGSHSSEYYRESFSSHSHHDTVIFSANSYISEVDPGTFYDAVDTFNDEARHISGHISKLDPETLVKKVRNSYQELDDKRFIIHFMQPHEPYFGEYPERLREELFEEHGLLFYAWADPSEYDTLPKDKKLKSLLKAARQGYITTSQLERAYTSNLEYVLSYVEELIEMLDGKTVITSDHGELLGDRSIVRRDGRKEKYGHYRRLYAPELRIVPWFEVNYKNRRLIKSEEPREITDYDPDAISEQLELLGYK